MNEYGFEYWEYLASRNVPDEESIGAPSSSQFGSKFSEEWVSKNLRLKAGMTVGDLGCGYGRFSIPIARRVSSVVAVDASTSMLRRVRRHIKVQEISNLHAIRASLTHLPLQDKSLDLGLCVGTIYYLPKPRAANALKEIRRASKRALVQFRNALSPYNIRRALLRTKPIEHVTFPPSLSLAPQFWKTYE